MASSKLELPEKVRNALHVLVAKLVEELEAERIYLFGSYARGDWMEDSDVDVIVVSEKFRDMEYGERYAVVKSVAPPGISLEVLAYTPEEFEDAVRRSVILQDAMEYAAALYEKNRRVDNQQNL